MRLLRPFVADESGVSSIEYGLLAALIGGALVASLNQLSSVLFGWYGRIGSAIGN